MGNKIRVSSDNTAAKFESSPLGRNEYYANQSNYELTAPVLAV